AGTYQTAAPAFEVWVVSERSGSWGQAHTVPNLISLNRGGFDGVEGLSCATASSCAMVGFYTDNNGHQQPFVANGTVDVPTAVSQTLAAHTVVYGHEQAERVSGTVTVRPGTEPVLAGSVAIKAGGVTACRITLNLGKGSCLIPATKFRAGQVGVAAAYGGTVDY